MIWQALENGFSEVENAAGRFPQVSGLVVEADFKQPKGSRVLSVTINGKPLDKAATYTLATNDFMAAGGDGYSMFKPAKNLIDPMGAKLLASAVIDYVTAKKKIAPTVEVVSSRKCKRAYLDCGDEVRRLWTNGPNRSRHFRFLRPHERSSMKPSLPRPSPCFAPN